MCDKLDDEVRKALENIPDTYDCFVNCYCRDLKGDTDNEQLLLQFIKDNPGVTTDKIMEYVDDELLQI